MMTYEESHTLMTDAAFRGRVKVAALKYADSIMNEAGQIPAHNTRMKWAKETMTQPDQAAFSLTPPTVMDSAVQSAGATVDDPTLQGAVEAVVNKLM